MNESFQRMKTSLQKAFSQAKFVSVTADGWSRGTKSFIGITAHWIDSELKRRSVALACRRLIGRHTYDVIAEKMEDVLVEFSIHNKTTAATTDNGSNFVKAFTLFSQENKFVDVDASVVDIAIDEELSFVELTDDLTLGGNDIYHLPPHFRCAAHTLNLVVTLDTKGVMGIPV